VVPGLLQHGLIGVRGIGPEQSRQLVDDRRSPRTGCAADVIDSVRGRMRAQ